MKWSTLQQHKEATLLCEKGMTTIEVRSAFSIPQSIKHAVQAKTQTLNPP
jgi:hypothetical protein